MISTYQIERSRAIEPLFGQAPCGHLVTPRSYQHAGVEFALARNHCLIGDAPGVGKTAQGVMISNSLRANRTLVVSPASLRLNWKEEIWKCSTVTNVVVHVVAKASDGINDHADYTVISYDLLRNDAIMRAIMALRWDHVILDEAHALKDPNGNKRTKVICAPDMLPSVSGRFTLLSGTILPNTPRECLGHDTLVLTDSGWKELIGVATTDLLWDGIEWVTHAGLLYQGRRPTLRVAGVTMTGNHEIAVGDGWESAGGLTENTLAQALATGSASLPFSPLPKGQRGASWRLLFNAIVGLRLSRPYPRTSQAAAQRGVDPAGQKLRKFATTVTQRFVQTQKFANAFSAGSETLSSDVTTRTLPDMQITVVEGLLCMILGEPTAELSWPTSSDCQGTLTRPFNSTGSKTTTDTGPAICGLELAKPTWETVENAACPSCALVLLNLKPVYDIMNAGPRRRFTILTERGPLIVHNCYNAARLLDWNCIDQMSLADFNEHYYGESGGMVFSPVWDEKLQAKVRKVHWSDEVRNAPQNLEELQGRLRSHIMVRRLKAQVLPQLPQKQFHLVPLATTADMRAALRHPGWARVGQLIEMDPADFAAGIGVDGAVSTARRMLGEAKIGPVCDYIDELMREGIAKLVVSAHHTSVLKVARERLEKYGLLYMDGSTPVAKRQGSVLSFQYKPEFRIILGQTQVLGEGHTLTAAQDVLLAEPDWVPGRIEQMVDRIHRIGQEGNHVTAHLPVVPGTLDEYVISTAVAKSKDIYLALDATA